MKPWPGWEGLLPLATALGIGLGVGALFGLLRVNVPAPSTAAGIAGVVGLYLGWALVRWVL